MCFYKGLGDCANIKKEMDCPSAANRCGKYKVETSSGGISAAVYAKGCTTKAECDMGDKSDLCKAQDPTAKVSCEVNCCEGDLCNGANLPVVSAVVLLACTLVAFLR